MRDYRLYKKRLAKAKIFGRIIAKIPYVKTVMLTGSLAEGRAEKKSDIDIMIITQTGRIFSARFFVNAIATLLGCKRSKNPNDNHAGKFCFNYFVTENFLKLPIGRGEKIDRYCAKNYSQAKFIAGEKGLYFKFFEVNNALFRKYRCSTFEHIKERVKTSRFERWSKKYQINRIESDVLTARYPNLITYNDNELRFHPPK